MGEAKPRSERLLRPPRAPPSVAARSLSITVPRVGSSSGEVGGNRARAPLGRVFLLDATAATVPFTPDFFFFPSSPFPFSCSAPRNLPQTALSVFISRILTVMARSPLPLKRRNRLQRTDTDPGSRRAPSPSEIPLLHTLANCAPWGKFANFSEP